MRHFLKTLEDQYDEEGSVSGTDVAGDDQIIRDVEEFLRNQRQDE